MAMILPVARPPLDQAQIVLVKGFLRANFGAAIDAAVAGTAVSSDLVCAIAGKETAIEWVGKIADPSAPALTPEQTPTPGQTLAPAQILGFCVFDASGDFPGTTRTAFPVNAAALRADPRFGDAVTDMLIGEANASRAALHGWGAAAYLYKGYGIFQYDLQYIVKDTAFFTGREWYDFGACLQRLMLVLGGTLAAHAGDLGAGVAAYNGSGPRAAQYSADVLAMLAWCED